MSIWSGIAIDPHNPACVQCDDTGLCLGKVIDGIDYPYRIYSCPAGKKLDPNAADEANEKRDRVLAIGGKR